MIYLTKEELNNEKKILLNEIKKCKDCQVEKKLGFKRCDLHNHYIKFLMEKTDEKDLSKVTRIEVIEVGETPARKYVKWDCKVEESIQDNGRTLKLFVEVVENV